ncbi:MAG: HAD family phosphatase [Anaerolineales bacterium]|nr:HAD family phosphatase [Anaerolineales bacterium]
MKSIIFDFGGVLIGWDPRNLYRRYFPDPQSMEDFLTEINFMEWNAQQDKGRPFAEGARILAEQFPQRAHLIHAFHENWKESITGKIDGTVEILQTLKRKNYPLYGLSNWSAETFPIVRDEFPFLNLFDGVILSGEVKLIKPDTAIYDLCLKMVGRPARECVFIDDSPANIHAANEMGFDAIKFDSPEQLKDELRAREIL